MMASGNESQPNHSWKENLLRGSVLKKVLAIAATTSLLAIALSKQYKSSSVESNRDSRSLRGLEFASYGDGQPKSPYESHSHISEPSHNLYEGIDDPDHGPKVYFEFDESEGDPAMRSHNSERSTSCIAVLVSNSESDLSDLCIALKSLFVLPSRKTPVLVFNEGDLSTAQRGAITECTDLPIAFPIVNFQSFPEGFDPVKEIEEFGNKWMSGIGVDLGRPRWGYQQMIRFWTTTIWKHPAIQEFETIMRIDTDSCFLDNQANDNPEYTLLPSIADQYVYSCKEPGMGSNKFIKGLYNFTLEYIKKENIVPQNPDLFGYIQSMMKKEATLPVTQTNYEITRRSFFQREDVLKWHEALTEHEPYGVFRKRWGDAQTRVLTMAMFAPKEAYQITGRSSYVHGRGKCQKYVDGFSSPTNY